MASWFAKLKGLDAYPKTIEEFKVRTTQGGFYSLVAFLFIVTLLISELRYFYTIDTVDKMLVDGTRNAQVPIHFDVTFPRMPCSVVAVESSDMSGAVHYDILSDVVKIPLDLNGLPYKEGQRFALGGALTNHTALLNDEQSEEDKCGSCYSAGEENQCCNTCEEVKAAYEKKSWILPSLHAIKQCQEAEIEQIIRNKVNEGCRISGHLSVSKVAGKFYFAPTVYFRNGYFSAQDALDATFNVFDTSHRINFMSFGERYPDMKNPLDNRERQLEGKVRGSYQYFLKVVPTEYTYLNGNRVNTNQFSVTEHFREQTPLMERGLPMVSFSYSFSPIMFRIEQYRKGLVLFLTSICAVIGGVYTIVGILDSITFSVLNKTGRTTSLGH